MASRGLFLCLALAATAAFLAPASALRGLKSIEVSGGSGFATQPVFPYCTCSDYQSTSSPYLFKLIDSGMDNSTAVGEMCFEIKYKGAQANSSSCYKSLEQSLFKIHLSMQPACPPSFDVTNRYITINGEPKTTGVQVLTYSLGSVVAMTKLNLNSTTADGAMVCVRAAYPCNIATNFFTNIPVPISVMESSAHRCCALSESW